MAEKKGYVYILTNPSFREDWVKIGKSSRPVNIRSKELDNTSIPLPFEVYATVESVKYNEIEVLLHKALTNLADKRIRKNREFFNIAPERALDYMEAVAAVIDDAIIDAPDEDDEDPQRNEPAQRTCGKRIVRYRVDTDQVFYIKDDIAIAQMCATGPNCYVVLEGATLNPQITSHWEYITRMRQEKKEAGALSNDGLTVVKDIVFETPSGAAEFVRGRSTNGKQYWLTADGRPLFDFIVTTEK